MAIVGAGLFLLMANPSSSFGTGAGRDSTIRCLARGLPPSPSLTSVSIAFSRFPLKPLRICIFFLSSVNPISLNVLSFTSMLLPEEPRSVPKTCDCLLTFGDGAGARLKLNLISSFGGVGGAGGLAFRCRPRLPNGSDAARKENPANLLPGFGGRAGPLLSKDLLLAGLSRPLVSTLTLRWPEQNTLSWYFALMNLCISESASSVSNGIFGFVLRGFRRTFDAEFPTRLMFYASISN